MRPRPSTILGCCVAAFATAAALLLLAAPGPHAPPLRNAPKSASTNEPPIDQRSSPPSRASSDRYRDRIAQLRAQAVASGKIDYQSVIEFAYRESSATAEILRRKAIYRYRMRDRCIWLADYRRLERSFTVRVVKSVFRT